MSKSQRQLAMLGLLLSVLAGVIVWRSNDSAPVAPPPVARRSTPVASEPPRAVGVSGLRLDLLASKPGELGDSTRNPFRFLARPVPAPQVVPVVARPAPVVPTGPVGPPPPPPIALKFIGLLDAPGRLGRLAILSDGRGGVFYGKEGDAIEGRYRVIRVSTETVELAYLDGRGRQTIRLSGQ